ncbi:hypothetical protein F4779DRAFT_637619 [Xylariaceae sp. FL0662B]|nr:hypothetical protein F4779DRAFT_637619 [Xylariaceae sp. FL0662B]
MAHRFPDHDLYAVLEVSSGASADEIRKAYRRLCLEFHPDKAGNTPQANEKFAKIQDAYETLRDPARRRKYDSHRSGQYYNDKNRDYKPSTSDRNGPTPGYDGKYPRPQPDQGTSKTTPKLPPWVRIFVLEAEIRLERINRALDTLILNEKPLRQDVAYCMNVSKTDKSVWTTLLSGAINAIHTATKHRDSITFQIARLRQWKGSTEDAVGLPERLGALDTEVFRMNCTLLSLQATFLLLRRGAQPSDFSAAIADVERLLVYFSESKLK